jgi:hypothetical protein
MSEGGRTGTDGSFAKRYAREFAVWFVASIAGWVLTRSLWLPIYLGWMMIATRVGRRLLPKPRGDWLVHLVPASIAVAVALGWRLMS